MQVFQKIWEGRNHFSVRLNVKKWYRTKQDWAEWGSVVKTSGFTNIRDGSSDSPHRRKVTEQMREDRSHRMTRLLLSFKSLSELVFLHPVQWFHISTSFILKKSYFLPLITLPVWSPFLVFLNMLLYMCKYYK